MTDDGTRESDTPMLDEIWSNVCARLKGEIKAQEFEHWIAPMALTGLRDGVARLSAPTDFIGDWTQRNYGDRLKWHLSDEAQARALGDVQRLSFHAGAPAQAASSKPAAPPQPTHGPKTSTAADSTTTFPTSPLNEHFTFDRFVVGKPNELAHAAARRVAEADEISFNPLFLYGASGLGKTHLMHAIAWRLREVFPEKNVFFLTAEEFMNQFVRALRYKDMLSFKAQFRSVDVLIIDDVQFIAGKDSTQDEFFHTFNALVDQGKQMVFAADQQPSEIEHLDERIKSRLQWGLAVDLHPTDFELRLGILQSKMDVQSVKHPGVTIEPKVLEYLAHRISSNVRVLEGALTRLFAFASLVGRHIDIDMTQECLADILRASERKVTIDEIQKQVATHFNLRMTDMLSPRRARAIARPRQMAMYLSKTLTSKSLPEIGRKFGGRDHTTVLHAVKKIDQLMATDPQIAEDVELLRRSLEG